MYLRDSLFDPDGEADIFFLNVRLSTNYIVLQPRRLYYSLIVMLPYNSAIDIQL